MKVRELEALEPKLKTYELNPGGRYLVCVDRCLTEATRTSLNEILGAAMKASGVKLIAFVDFIPTIFELQPETAEETEQAKRLTDVQHAPESRVP
jgi:hypothetical protein